jgi:type IV pilus assembly protein PilW
MMKRPFASRKAKSPAPLAQRGFSLVELMVAITIGMLIVAALLALFLNVTRNNRELAKANTQIENGRFAIQLLQSDLVHAGFWGELRPPVPAGIPDPCEAPADWDDADKANMLGVPVMGFSSTTIASATSCTTVSPAPVSSPQANSDILVVRHANTCATGSLGCDVASDTGPHIQVSSCMTSSPPEAAYVIDNNVTGPTAFSLRKKNCEDEEDVLRKVVSNIYYVSNNTLMRSAFVNGAYQAAQPLIDGIEVLRFEFGIDDSGDGSPDRYEGTAPTTLPDLANVVAIRIHILARTLERTPGYTDTKAYEIGGVAYTVPTGDVGFKRHVFTSTVRLVNPSGRREVP